MKKIIILNQNKYFYFISQFIYKLLSEYFNNIYLDYYNNSYIFTDDLYILFYILDKLPQNYIVYNFEQFTTNKKWSNSYYNFLNNAIINIDYSINNIIKLHKNNINSFFLPFFSLNLFKYQYYIKKDIDILFLGNINQRRKSFLNKLNFLNITIINNVFFDDSIKLLARSKILLNIHYYDGDSILEVVRIIPALENNCIIISEKSNDIYYNNKFNNIIHLTDYDNILNDVNNILNNYTFYYEQLRKKKNINNINYNIVKLIELINIIIN